MIIRLPRLHIRVGVLSEATVSIEPHEVSFNCPSMNGLFETGTGKLPRESITLPEMVASASVEK